MVTRPGGTWYIYQGYEPLWRTNANPLSGRLIQIIDTNENRG